VLVSAVLKRGSIPEQALLKARADDVIAQSRETAAELTQVLARPKFAAATTAARRETVLRLILDDAVWFVPSVTVTDCRDRKDNKYLELA